MKMNLALSFVACSILAASALAGVKSYTPLWIEGKERRAGASLADTRATADQAQVIGCSVAAVFGQESMVCAGCTENECFVCSSSSPQNVATVRALTADSHIYVQWNASGECDVVAVWTSSAHSPAQP